jgi:hypothetical protein
MIPKDILTNLYLELYQVNIKRGGRIVRGGRPDRPAGPRGLSARPSRPSARLVGSRCISGRSVSFNGPSAPWVRTVHAPRGPSTLLADCPRGRRGLSVPAACQWDPSREGDKFAASLLVPKLKEGPSSLSFLPSLNEKAPSLGILIRALPGPSELIPGLSARFSTMPSGYFFESLILFLGF